MLICFYEIILPKLCATEGNNFWVGFLFKCDSLYWEIQVAHNTYEIESVNLN